MKKLIPLLLSFLIANQAFPNSIGEDVNAFALALSSKLEEKDENLAFSPYSIFSNLSLLYFGAEGQTASQIKSALHMSETGDKFLNAFSRSFEGFTKEQNAGYQLKIANALFPHKGTHFLHKFRQTAQDVYRAKLHAVDYDLPDMALETINTWVSNQTMGKIPSIMEEGDIDPSIRLVIANACYFQGEWVYPFREKMLLEGPFYRPDGSEQKTRYLHQTSYFPYFEDERLEAVALPFVRNSTNQPFLECLVILPKKGSLTKLEDALGANEIDEILTTSQSQLIDLSIPKFCFSKRISLNEPLKALGMDLPFTYRADFSEIDGMRDLFLNKVLHETYFSFHENGVTAASATTSSIGVTSMPPSKKPSVVFNANHPFLFMIIDTHSKVILFMGRVTSPEECNAN